VLHIMLERRIGHLPVVENGALVGMVTQTDLTRFQAVSSAQFVRDAAMAETDVPQLAAVTARIPKLLAQLVGAHNAHEVVTRLITDIADTVTRRLLGWPRQSLGPRRCPICGWPADRRGGRSRPGSAIRTTA
jgi:CBS domain-containing protein